MRGAALWATAVAAGVGTYAIRASWLVAARHTLRLPGTVRRPLRMIPAAVLAALAVPGVLAPDGRVGAGPELWAAVAAAVAGWRTGNVVVTLVVGMTVLVLAGG